MTSDRTVEPLPGSWDTGPFGRLLDPPELGLLLPSQRQVARGSTTVHGAWLIHTRLPVGWSSAPFDHVYPSFTAVCGVRGWGEASGHVTCKNCIRILTPYFEHVLWGLERGTLW